jgi:hypothetical protein
MRSAACECGADAAFAKAARLRQVLKGGALYFALVFGAGFALGTVRVLLVVPRVGERTAELLETPVMLAVTFLAARWVVMRFSLTHRASRLGAGCIALALLLIAEALVVLWVRHLTMSEYFATRDPVSGTVYVLMLVFFALMPLFVRTAR